MERRRPAAQMDMTFWYTLHDESAIGIGYGLGFVHAGIAAPVQADEFPGAHLETGGR